MARPFELFVAMRYLRGRRRMGFISFITWTSAAGVFLGSLVLVVALSIANGFEKEVRDRIVGITAHAKILQYYGRPIANYDSLRLRILKCPNVVAATPYIMEKGGIEYESVKEGVMITGAIAATETTVTEVGRKITFGKFALDSAFSSRNRKLPGIVLGIGMADKMGVRPGAEVVVGGLTAEAANGEITSIPMARFVVRGIFETGMYEYDLNLVYISIQACQSLFSMNGVEGIAIRTSDMFRADAIAHNVKDSLGGYPYRCIDWKSQNKSLFDWMRLEAVCDFPRDIAHHPCCGVQHRVVARDDDHREASRDRHPHGHGRHERRHHADIHVQRRGDRRARVHARRGARRAGVLAAGLRFRFIPLPGDIYFIDKLPVLIQWSDIIAIYIAANVICFLATLYPAWSASRVPPADSIRIE